MHLSAWVSMPWASAARALGRLARRLEHSGHTQRSMAATSCMNSFHKKHTRVDSVSSITS